MKIRLVKVGKLVLPVKPLFDIYLKRLQAFAKVEAVYLKNLEQTEKLLLEGKAKGGGFVVLLDERGKQFSSPALAQFVKEKAEDSLVKTLTFVVGGPFGLGEELRSKADFIWSLSPAVFPSDLAWLLLGEQLYRASSIIQGSPYHHE